MYKSIWFKIHWILGIITGIILLIVGVTGGILSFEKEILRFINKNTYVVEIPDYPKLRTEKLLKKFQKEFPNSKINSISFSNDLNSSVMINIAGKGSTRAIRKGVTYFVNPYTGKILPELKGKSFFQVILNLHRRLMLGEIGKQLVAISTVSLLILIFSGLYLYWPKIKRSFLKSLTFSFKYRGRAFLSIMHSSIGIWVLPFYLLVSITGLFWSYEWYNQALYQIAGVEKPQRYNKYRNIEKENKKRVERNLNIYNNKFAEYEKAINKFDDFLKGNYSSAFIRFPQNGTVYTFNYLDNNPAHFRARNKIEFDLKSNYINNHEIYKEKKLSEKLIKSILPLHSGEYFGLLGQIGMCIASLLLLLFPITGIMLYFNRTKKRKYK